MLGENTFENWVTFFQCVAETDREVIGKRNKVLSVTGRTRVSVKW